MTNTKILQRGIDENVANSILIKFNQIAMILANLGTHICDPANRLRVVQASVREAKKRFAQMSPEEILNFTALSMAPTGLNLLTGLAPKWRAFNVTASFW